MKKYIQKTALILGLPAVLLTAQGCMILRPVPVVVVQKNHRHVPPGQAKKIHGHQSAKYFAPGHKLGHHKHHDHR